MSFIQTSLDMESKLSYGYGPYVPATTYYISRPPSSSSPRAMPMLPAAAPATSSPFDSSIGLTILILLGALFFMGFFSIYIRRFAAVDDSQLIIPTGRRRHLQVLAPVSTSAARNCLDPTIVRDLPCYAYDGSAKYQADCPVCLSEFAAAETVKVIPRCRHVFHAQCIDRWLGSHSSCPVCRATQLLDVVSTSSYVAVSETATYPTTSDVEDEHVGSRAVMSAHVGIV